MSSLAPGLSVVPRGRLSPVTGRRGGSVETSGRHLLSSSAITSRSLLCLQFTKGPLLQISVWSTVLGSPQIQRIRIRIKNKILIQSTYKILSESNNLTITSRENKKGHGKWQGRAGDRKGGGAGGWEGQGRARRQGGGGYREGSALQVHVLSDKEHLLCRFPDHKGGSMVAH